MPAIFSLDPAFRDAHQSLDDDISIDAISINPQSVLNKGIALMELNRYEEALKAFNRTIEIDQQFVEAWYKKGEALIGLGRNDEAQECFNKVVNLDCFPQSMYSMSRKANALMMLGKFDEALDCFYQVTRLDPKDFLGTFNKIVKLFKRKVELEPGNAYAWNDLGSAFYKQHEYNESLTSYNMSLEINPKSSVCWYNKGVVLAKSGNHDGALQCYEEAIKFNPQYAKAWLNKGAILNAAGNYIEAKKCYEEAVNINPQYAKPWYNKGLIHARMNDYENAIIAFDKAIEIDPCHDKAKFAKNRATIFMKGFTPIIDLEHGMHCSILGYLTRLREERSILKDNGTIAKLLIFFISDGTGQVRVVLWDDQVKLIDGPHVGYQVKVTDCYVKEGWNEPLELGFNYRTKIVFSIQDSLIVQDSN